MNKEIIWSSAAENDLALFLEYLNFKWNKDIANSFLDSLDRNLSRVSSDPKLFPIFNKISDIRKCVITKHNTLYYKEYTSEIVLLRLYDSRQHPNKLKF